MIKGERNSSGPHMATVFIEHEVSLASNKLIKNQLANAGNVNS